MVSLQRMGGIAALTMAASYLVGIVLFLLILDPGRPLGPAERITHLVDNEAVMYSTTLFVYVAIGFVLVVLVQALYERLKAVSPSLMQTAAVFGYIWAGIVIAGGMIFLIGLTAIADLYGEKPEQAVAAWFVVEIVFEGLGGGIETIGGLWALLISWAAMRSEEFPKLLNYLGLIVGVAGIVTIIPALADMTMVFGLGQIPWFIGVGLVLLRSKTGYPGVSRG